MEILQQAGAIPVHHGTVCLITSRRSRRWIIPKGRVEPNKTHGQTALAEAWEEAGVTGSLSAEPVGSYLDLRRTGPRLVLVYLMVVTEILTRWPEKRMRDRCWVTPVRALDRIEHEGLRDLVQGILLPEKGMSLNALSTFPWLCPDELPVEENVG